MQCEQAACVSVCPVTALVRNLATGAIEVAEDRCIGCQACVGACPFGAIAMLDKRPIAYKCDLCGGEPACVAFCPSKALEYRAVAPPVVR
jgi:Fe-S-cluster-containing hydrogenase component 2